MGKPGDEAHANPNLASSITWAASKQTYYTIRWLVDRDLVRDAYCTYAYFRWVDDVVDIKLKSRDQRLAFVQRQKGLIEAAYQGAVPDGLSDEERLLVTLVRHDRREHGGLESSLRNMMTVMAFDAGRRGRLINQGELDQYTRDLSIAVMDGLRYFIGHRCRYPASEGRYSAVVAAHITHMLRDAVADAQAGYYNVPRETLKAGHISPLEVHSRPYRNWVRDQVGKARDGFRQGKHYINSLPNVRSRLAGLLYCARFEFVLDTIERDGFLLRADYAESPSRHLMRLFSGWLDVPAIFRGRSSHERNPG